MSNSKKYLTIYTNKVVVFYDVFGREELKKIYLPYSLTKTLNKYFIIVPVDLLIPISNAEQML